MIWYFFHLHLQNEWFSLIKSFNPTEMTYFTSFQEKRINTVNKGVTSKLRQWGGEGVDRPAMTGEHLNRCGDMLCTGII